MAKHVSLTQYMVEQQRILDLQSGKLYGRVSVSVIHALRAPPQP